MTKNIGTTDKIIRVIVGIAALAAGYFVGGWVLYAGIVVAIAMFVTAAIGWCGLYALFGWNTCPMKTEEKKEEPAAPAETPK